MTIRVFSSSVIVLDEGALDNIFNGAFTIAVLFKRSGSTTDGLQALLSFNGGVNSNQRASIGYTTGSALQLSVGGLSRTFGASFTISNNTWYLFVVRKASGTQTPTANLWNYSTGAWVGWTNGSGTLDNDGTALVEVRMGNAPGGFPLNGKMGGAVVYNSVLSDSNGETLETGAQEWFDLSPQAMWRLNQAATTDPVVDDTGNGADETSITGTSVDSGDDPGPTPVFDFTIGGGDQDVEPTGIASGEAFGTAVITAGAVDVAPTGIASGEAFGTPVVTTANTVAPTGIASGEAFGAPVVAAGAVDIAPTGIASGEAFGTPVVTTANTVAPTGIASGEAFGTPIVADSGSLIIAPAGIASAEAFGTAAVTTGPVTIAPTGITSAEAFGAPLVTDSSQGQIVAPVGIPSGERFGRPVIWIHIVRRCDCSVLVDD